MHLCADILGTGPLELMCLPTVGAVGGGVYSVDMDRDQGTPKEASKTVSFRLSDEARRLLEDRAAGLGRSVGQLAKELVQESLLAPGGDDRNAGPDSSAEPVLSGLHRRLRDDLRVVLATVLLNIDRDRSKEDVSEHARRELPDLPA